MRIAVAYCRVSTIDQATEGISLDAQQARVTAWAESAGVRLDPAHVFVDAGISGKRADNRPALQKALDAVCRAGGVLVVYSLSRLARSTKDTIAISERLQAHGADLVSLSEQLDTTSAAGKMLFRLLAVLAEFERDLVSERTRVAMAHKRAKSERCGQVPYGRSLGADGRTLHKSTTEAEALGKIRGWRRDGWSLRRIAAALTEQKYPTKNGGAEWSHSTVGHLLRHERRHAQQDRPTTAPPLPDVPVA